ncbi:MAG: AsnC family protein [Acidocella sp. 20-63-7]|nr:MAG: AsnC family protein [Acidocella sp. 20-63-7]
MPQARKWTEAADFTICQMRAGGETWAEIGRVLGLSRNTVIERGRRLRAEAPVKPTAVPARAAVSEDPNRGALRAGHPLTWGLLTKEPYPGGDAP